MTVLPGAISFVFVFTPAPEIASACASLPVFLISKRTAPAGAWVVESPTLYSRSVTRIVVFEALA